MKYIATTATQLDQIKSRAKVLRPHFERLGHARDAAARESGFEDYHHAHWCALESARGTSRREDRHLGLATYAISRLPEMLRRDPALNLDHPPVKQMLSKSGGLEIVRQELQPIHLNGGREYFRAAVHDYLQMVPDFAPSVEYHHSEQMLVADSVWESLLRGDQAGSYDLLSGFAALKVLAGYMAFIEGVPASEASKQETRKLAALVHGLLAARSTDEAVELVFERGDVLMPREMNISIHTGKEDYEEPSSYWTRIAAAISIEMAGTISNLPFGLLQNQLDTQHLGAPVPFFTMLMPTDSQLRRRYLEAARSRF